MFLHFSLLHHVLNRHKSLSRQNSHYILLSFSDLHHTLLKHHQIQQYSCPRVYQSHSSTQFNHLQQGWAKLFGCGPHSASILWHSPPNIYTMHIPHIFMLIITRFLSYQTCPLHLTSNKQHSSTILFSLQTPLSFPPKLNNVVSRRAYKVSTGRPIMTKDMPVHYMMNCG